MTLEQVIKWKHGSFEEYEKLINEQESLLKKVRKLNNEIEKVEDARSCFNSNNVNDVEMYNLHDDKIKALIREKEQIGLYIKGNNERLEREFY